MDDLLPLTDDLVERWDEAVTESPDGCFWHTSASLRYEKIYSPFAESDPASFALVQGSRVVGVCPMFIERYAEGEHEGTQFAIGGDYCPAPALRASSPGELKRLRARVFELIDRCAADKGVDRVRLRLSPLGANGRQASGHFNHLTAFGYVDTSIHAQLIDLKLEDEELLAGMRKSARQELRKGLDRIAVEVIDSQTRDLSRFDIYPDLHRKAAGRITRPLETFAVMRGWIKSGHGILLLAAADGADVGAVYVNLFRDGAYYRSAAVDPDFDHLPVGHTLLWHAVEQLRARELRWFDLGWQQFGMELHATPSKKEVSIAWFKRGLGGATVPLWQGERYYSRVAFRAVMAARMERLSASIRFPS